ncbi:CUG-BP- and ETR-3-like factor [Achlya hypogyna]|uniref:CUG-BP-and ETR-3-like factor n=1 Tax=Achlya hypogyna TaxID=1202772 RepID=A0A1V9ZMV5_ACHHY|nr:CUG-BP- and ETR-3-like factor [Achlya hypogyna]
MYVRYGRGWLWWDVRTSKKAYFERFQSLGWQVKIIKSHKEKAVICFPSFPAPSMTDALHNYPSPGGYSVEYDEQDVDDYGGHHTHSQPPDAVKLFVGQVPRTMEEADLRPILEAFGPLYDIVIIRDKVSGTHRGCAFVTFCTRAAAEAAIETLHNQVTLPMSSNPLQVRPAEGQAGASQEHKLFIGMIPKHADESSIREVFAPHGAIEEIYILRHPATGQSKGCAFLKFKDRHSASTAIEAFNGTYTMDRGTAPLVVKFADSRRQRIQRARNQAATAAAAYWQLPPGGTIPFPQLQQIQQQYMQQMQAFGAQALAGQMSPGSSPSPAANPAAFMYYNQYAFAAASGYTGFPSGVAPPFPLDALATAVPGAAAASGARAATQLEGPAGANLFIYHLPHDLTDADLATAFAPFGTVISAKVFMDKNTGESKGFGFVSYDSVAAADAAIASMNGFQIGSKRLKVQHKRVHQREDYGDDEDEGMSGLEHSVHGLHLDA